MNCSIAENSKYDLACEGRQLSETWERMDEFFAACAILASKMGKDNGGEDEEGKEEKEKKETTSTTRAGARKEKEKEKTKERLEAERRLKKEKKVGQVQAEISQEVWMIITNGIGIGIPVDQCQYTFQKTIC